MKRFLLWLLGVALGFAAILTAVMGISYALTTEGGMPTSQMQFGGKDLTPNGYNWQLPLMGGELDRVFASSQTLEVQKLGVLYDAHPALALPSWATYSVIEVSDGAGTVLFRGSAEEYEAFLYPANGEYKANLTVWRLPEGMMVTEYPWNSNNSLERNAGLEHPARPTGCYQYSFRYQLQASAEITLSAQTVEQGGIVGMRISGMVGTDTPVVETDLGSVQCVRAPAPQSAAVVVGSLQTGAGWRCYIPAAYNASVGAHTITVQVNGETLTVNLTVTARDFGEAEAQPEPPATEEANAQFRNLVWPLYEQPAREKLWSGRWLCPVSDYVVLVDYGQVKVVNGQRGSRSNSTLLYTIPGEPVMAPANGVVVLAQNLALTGNTVVIDHGCGMRSYLYGLADIHVSVGQTVAQGDTLGPVGEELTMDFKLGSKSVNPWRLFQTSGGLFWME